MANHQEEQNQNNAGKSLRIEELTNRNAELESRIAELEKHIAELKIRNAKLPNDNAELENRNEKLNDNNANLEQRIAVLTEHNAKLQHHNAELEERNAELQKNNAELQSKLAVKKQEKGISAVRAASQVTHKVPLVQEHLLTDNVLRSMGMKIALDERREQLMLLLQTLYEHDMATLKELIELTQMSEDTLVRMIKRITVIGWMRRIGGQKMGGYRLTEEGKALFK